MKALEEGAVGTTMHGEVTERERFHLEQRKAVLLTRLYGLEQIDILIREILEVFTMLYQPMNAAFDTHFVAKVKIFLPRDRFFSLVQESEAIDKYIDRVGGAGRTCRLSGLQDELVLQVVMKEDIRNVV